MNKLKLTSFLFLCLILINSTKVEAKDGIKFHSITLKQALTKAEKENKLVFVDIGAVWCPPCKHLINNIFPDKDLGEFMNENFVSIRLDGEKGEGDQLMTKYNLGSFPTMLFLSWKNEKLEMIEGAVAALEIIKVGKKAMSSTKLVAPTPVPITPKPTPTPPATVAPGTPNPVIPPVKAKRKSSKGNGPNPGLSKSDSSQLDSVYSEVSKRGEKTKEEIAELADRVDESEQKIKWYLIVIGGGLVLGFVLLMIFSKKRRSEASGTVPITKETPSRQKRTQEKKVAGLKGVLLDDSGIFGGADFIVQGTLTVGREEGSSIQFPGSIKEVSRNHAVLKKEGLYLFVTDLGSSNGTFVNEEKIRTNQAVQLHAGDKIYFGKKRFGFKVK
jgi:thioredoxin-related protein